MQKNRIVSVTPCMVLLKVKVWVLRNKFEQLLAICDIWDTLRDCHQPNKSGSKNSLFYFDLVRVSHISFGSPEVSSAY